MNVFEVIKHSGYPGMVIIALAFFGLAIVFDRVKALYFDYAIKEDEFMNQVKGAIMADKIEEAITLCSARGKVPLAHVVKALLERADRDDDSIEQGMEVAMSEVIPSLGKRLSFISMIANVSTLIGLLGTVSGLIMSFEAVAKADPSQKQELLSSGIAIAMNTTAVGLTVAITMMVIYSFLHARQARLLEQIAEHSIKVVDWLSARHYQAFSVDAAFPDKAQQNFEPKGKPTPPPSKAKAS